MIESTRVALPRFAQSVLRDVRLRVLLSTVATLVAFAATTAGAQTLVGRVVDAESRFAVRGANVILLDSAGRRLAGALTNEAGEFSFRFRAAGRFTLIAEMIGRASVSLDTVAAWPESLSGLVLEMPAQPIQLSAIDVRSNQVCTVGTDQGLSTHMVWNEARKAISALRTVHESNLFTFQIARYQRLVDPRTREVLEVRRRSEARTGDEPFVSAAPQVLASMGYYEDRDGGSYYLHGPSSVVLLSEEFLNTHCLKLTRSGERPGQVAVSFEPLRSRRVTDIRGNIWLDESTAHLRTLEFTYVNLPASVPQGPHGGRAEFLVLPGGGVVVKEWELWTPVIEAVEDRVGSIRIMGQEVTALQSEGGTIVNIIERRGGHAYLRRGVRRHAG